MVSIKNANAMAEVLYYLKGIRQEDINRIPKKFIEFLNDNASKEYICNFDYNKPLNELELLDETRGIIGMICYNYWCITEEEKTEYLRKIAENEQRYQEELRKKYNPDDIFKNKDNNNIEQNGNEETALVEYKENLWVKFKKFILRVLHIKN